MPTHRRVWGDWGAYPCYAGVTRDAPTGGIMPESGMYRVNARRLVVVHKTWLLTVAMAILAVVAVVPPFLFRDRGTDLPPIVLRQLKVEASHGFTIPPGVMQVIDIRAHGEYPYQVEGTVVYRSLFGVPVASARSYNHATVYDHDNARFGGIVVGLILAEGVLGLLLFKWR